MAELTDEMRGWLKAALLYAGVPEENIHADPRSFCWQVREFVRLTSEKLTRERELWSCSDYEVAFTPGQYITEAWWEFGKAQLQKVGLWRILKAVGVKELRVVPNDQLPPGIPPGGWTIHQADMAIIAGDAQPFPAQVFPGRIVHETLHLWQQSNPSPSTGEGTPIDPIKAELPAYTLNWVYHLLSGDGIKVFRVPAGETQAYPGASELQ